jgi:hypothetical protein
MLGRVPARVAVPMRRGACDGRLRSVTMLMAEGLRLALWRADRLRRGDRRCRGRRGNRDRRRRSRGGAGGAGGADNPTSRARTRVTSRMHTVDRGPRSRHGRGRGEDRRYGGDRRSRRRSALVGRSRGRHVDASSRTAERGQKRYRLALPPGARQQEQRKRKADRRPEGEDGWREVGERRLHLPEVVRVLAVRSAGERRYTKDSAESAEESTPSGSFLLNPAERKGRGACSSRARKRAASSATRLPASGGAAHARNPRCPRSPSCPGGTGPRA